MKIYVRIHDAGENSASTYMWVSYDVSNGILSLVEHAHQATALQTLDDAEYAAYWSVRGGWNFYFNPRATYWIVENGKRVKITHKRLREIFKN